MVGPEWMWSAVVSNTSSVKAVTRLTLRGIGATSEPQAYKAAQIKKAYDAAKNLVGKGSQGETNSQRYSDTPILMSHRWALQAISGDIPWK